ncbi:MAG: DUF5053 domain-containing protein [Tannerellaceae bacterium]|jgi:hypothetical protein|nr:DUF5053 domain-containing protein [Tannerellaceae bacterium]
MKQNELSTHFEAYSKIADASKRNRYYDEIILPLLNNEDAGQFSDTLEAMKSETKTLKDNILFMEITKGINLSYIAEHYFGKSKSWLYHRIKGSVVNGRPVRFKDEELVNLQQAFDDMSKKLQRLSISLT